ncbi:hypothetical protein JQS43_02405 [Natronosporangium hydrolyticum]|uniref:Alpha-L-glutamate ligase-related protein ATP-grasp domain-containing protein n=1 Tax=Natronosporangium hydrolyticum TaxID=2811111 RepID=A0A895YBT5_9ACTN|nr:sugar-transfer associated ATP-grasp domain-containing protein [Natronosporangium hydrolyticum]QSB15237.1 hypothetical protein JQS43_02405 [Natronosporangium hydrolyticum]
MRPVVRRLRAGWRRRERVVPVVLPATRRRWRRAAATDPAAQLHLLYARRRHEVLPRYFAKFDAYPPPRTGVTRAWRWYISDVLIQGLRVWRRHSGRIRREAGVPRGRQLRELLWTAVRLPSVPDNYYTFELFRPEQRARADAFLHRHETKGALYELLAGAPDVEQAAPLNDKVAFAAHATAAQLPVVPTLAVVGGGAEPGPEQPLPATDLFIKPLAGKGGRGAQRWRYQPDADAFSRDGQVVPRSSLLSSLAGVATATPLLVQPCLTSHPELSDLALGAVATARVITILDESDEPEPVIAIFRMPAVADAIVDNMHRGGIAAPIDIDSGELGPASGYTTTRYLRHPVTDGAIAGRKLPRWDEVRQLVMAAHRAFRPRVLVGWDVTIGPDGPMLIEGNEQPGVDGLQRLHGTPLGNHRFGQLLAGQLSGGGDGRT